MAQQSTVVVYF